MNNFQAQQTFWESFGIDAYQENSRFTLGESPTFPHITYESASGLWTSQKTLSAHLYNRSESWAYLLETAESIKNSIGNGGVQVAVDDGVLWFRIPESTPFAQPIISGSTDDLVKRVLLSVEVEFLTV